MNHHVPQRFVAIAFLIITCLASTIHADSIDDVLGQKHIEQIYNFLEGKGYKTVGLLNFSLKRDQLDNSPTFQAGPISRSLPIRIQNALALWSPGQFGNEIRLIDDACRVIEKSGVNSYQNQEERDKLFSLDFPILAYPKTAKATLSKADVFIVGDVAISADRKQTTVTLKYFDNQSNKEPTEFHKIVVPTDLTILAESGISFALNARDFDKIIGKQRKDKLLEVAGPALEMPDKQKVKEKTEPVTTNDTQQKSNTSGGTNDNSGTAASIMVPCSTNELIWKDWVDLTVLYEDAPQTVYRNPDDRAKFLIKEPKEGQKISFKIKNVSNEKLGIVLLVNKHNVLDSEDIETDTPDKFSKLILMPNGQGVDEFTVKGYIKLNTSNLEDSKVQLFEIMSSARTIELARHELGKSNHYGHITLYVFRDINGSSEGAVPGESAKFNLRKQSIDNEQFTTLAKALGSHLESKGYIAGGAQAEKLSFSNDRINNPQQVVSASIRYLPRVPSNLPGVEKR